MTKLKGMPLYSEEIETVNQLGGLELGLTEIAVGFIYLTVSAYVMKRIIPTGYKAIKDSNLWRNEGLN